MNNSELSKSLYIQGYHGGSRITRAHLNYELCTFPVRNQRRHEGVLEITASRIDEYRGISTIPMYFIYTIWPEILEIPSKPRGDLHLSKIATAIAHKVAHKAGTKITTLASLYLFEWRCTVCTFGLGPVVLASWKGGLPSDECRRRRV